MADFDAADQFIDTQRNRLRKARRHAGQVAESASRIFSTSSSLDLGGRPFFTRLERDDHIAEFNAHRIGRDVGAASFRNDVDRLPEIVSGFSRLHFAARAIAASEMLGMRNVCTATEPSSSDGRNSVPISGTRRSEAISAMTAAE